jgi:hypothetical protein
MVCKVLPVILSNLFFSHCGGRRMRVGGVLEFQKTLLTLLYTSQ